jgi:hypothetical protein
MSTPGNVINIIADFMTPAIRVERDRTNPNAWLVITPSGMAWLHTCPITAQADASYVASTFGYGVRVIR